MPERSASSPRSRAHRYHTDLTRMTGNRQARPDDSDGSERAPSEPHTAVKATRAHQSRHMTTPDAQRPRRRTRRLPRHSNAGLAPLEPASLVSPYPRLGARRLAANGRSIQKSRANTRPAPFTQPQPPRCPGSGRSRLLLWACGQPERQSPAGGRRGDVGVAQLRPLGPFLVARIADQLRLSERAPGALDAGGVDDRGHPRAVPQVSDTGALAAVLTRECHACYVAGLR